MSLIIRLQEVLNQIAVDIKNITSKQGNLVNLNTTQKNDLVSAINEVLTATNNIDDTSNALNKTLSANKINNLVTSLKNEILGGASSAYDTLKELQEALVNDQSSIANLMTAIGNKVSYSDNQNLTAPQKLIASTNIGIGDTETDLLAYYNQQKV